MKLYGSPTSPYVRKARVVIHEKKVPCEWVSEDPWVQDSPIPRRNPLGKVPALEIEPNNYLFESMLIVHYLDHVDGKSLTPKDAAGYWQAQWWQALAQGMIDAAVARVLESRRPEDRRMPEKIAREEARIHRAIAAAEQRFNGDPYLVARRLSLADLMMGVALQYIDFRYAHDWRSEAPKLARWHGNVTARRSFVETLPPGFEPPAA
ncbi:MAG TPA: glutathione S-transferase N-terminal domain-containing protein [Burkholderiales bacterium]|nr:glutathione S-transferase N-terminal domain-containing protein [Burkholderiales bacterium]